MIEFRREKEEGDEKMKPMQLCKSLTPSPRALPRGLFRRAIPLFLEIHYNRQSESGEKPIRP